jgi:hypothetical protein
MKCRLFEKLCQEMDAEHKTFLLHTETSWLSRGRTMNRVLALPDEPFIFFETEKPEYSEKIKDTVWCAELAYVADIFNKLNSLNSSMQGRNDLISASDKMNN